LSAILKTRRARGRRANILVLAAVTTAAVALAGCAGSSPASPPAQASPSVTASAVPTDKPGGTLRIVTDAMPTGDPGWADDTGSQVFSRLVSRTLYSYPADADAENTVIPQPDLALGQPVRSDNDMTYTVRIGSAALWHTTVPRHITATDVADGLKRLCLPPTPSPLRGYFSATIVGFNDYCTELFTTPLNKAEFIETRSPVGLEVVNDNEIAFHLVKPINDFVEVLALPAAAPVPVEALSYLPNSPDFLANLVSDGPYRITGAAGGVYSLSRTPEWFNSIDGIRKALPDHITITTGVNAATAESYIEAGKADMTLDTAVPLARAMALQAAGDPRLSVPTTGSEVMLVAGMHGPDAAVMGDLSTRQTLAYCVNRISVTEALGGPPFARAATQLLQPTMTGYSPLDLFPSQSGAGDAAKCGQGLAHSPGGPVTQLTLLTTDSAQDAAVAGALVSTFAKVGVKLNVDARPAGGFAAAAVSPRSQSWDLALTTVTPLWYGKAGRTVFQPLFDPTWTGHRPADGGYGASGVLSKIEDALEATTDTARAAIWTEVDTEVLRDVAVIPLVVVTQPRLHSSSVLSFVQIPSLGTGDPTAVALGTP
jgi:peptide/nickel transport system substrate-binding protein